MASSDWRVPDARGADVHLQALCDLADSLRLTRDTSEIYQAALDALLRTTAADRAGILTFDADCVMRFKAWHGLSDRYRAAVEGEFTGPGGSDPVMVRDVGWDAHSEGIRAMAWIPLFGSDGVTGQFLLGYNTPHELGEDEIRTAQIIAAHVVTAAERRAAGIEQQKLSSAGVLIRGVAHDINNLLGSILVDAELAEADLADGASPAEQIQRVKSVAIRASEIVRELMVYSGQDKAAVGPVDLSRLVTEMLGLLKVSVSKHAVLQTRLEQRLPAVRGNAAQLRQVVMNLILNASEAIGTRDGTILAATSLAPDGDWIRLEISDTGAGMTEEQQAKVFDPFFTTKLAGRGLGLAVVREVVRAHQGSIEVASEPGRGTRFTIRLPRAAAPASPDTPDEIPIDAVPAAGEGTTILLVEDEDSLRAAVSRVLSMKGFHVIEASDGTAAADLLCTSSEKIDLILLDVTIPGLPGREVIAHARRTRPGARLMLMSAYSRETAVAALGGAAIDGFLRKPFPAAYLLRFLGSPQV